MSKGNEGRLQREAVIDAKPEAEPQGKRGH
jgi:hypothetical protein